MARRSAVTPPEDRRRSRARRALLARLALVGALALGGPALAHPSGHVTVDAAASCPDAARDGVVRSLRLRLPGWEVLARDAPSAAGEAAALRVRLTGSGCREVEILAPSRGGVVARDHLDDAPDEPEEARRVALLVALLVDTTPAPAPGVPETETDRQTETETETDRETKTEPDRAMKTETARAPTAPVPPAPATPIAEPEPVTSEVRELPRPAPRIADGGGAQGSVLRASASPPGASVGAAAARFFLAAAPSVTVLPAVDVAAPGGTVTAGVHLPSGVVLETGARLAGAADVAVGDVTARLRERAVWVDAGYRWRPSSRWYVQVSGGVQYDLRDVDTVEGSLSTTGLGLDAEEEETDTEETEEPREREDEAREPSSREEPSAPSDGSATDAAEAPAPDSAQSTETDAASDGGVSGRGGALESGDVQEASRGARWGLRGATEVGWTPHPNVALTAGVAGVARLAEPVLEGGSGARRGLGRFGLDLTLGAALRF